MGCLTMNQLVTIVTTIASNPGVFLIMTAIIAVMVYTMWHTKLSHDYRKHQHTVKVNRINTELQKNAVNPSTNLPEKLDKALDEYDQLGIRIPADIIKDLSTVQFTAVDPAMRRIELHSNIWKVENSKEFRREVS